MENNSKPSMFQTTLIWGLITGLATVIYSLILYFLDLSLNKAAGYLSYVIIIGGIFLGSKAYRDQSLGGFISYGKALGTGVLISLFTSILFVVYTILLYTVIDPELVNKTIEMSQLQLEERGMNADQIEKGMEITKNFFVPLAAVSVFFAFVFFGFIFSLITSAIVKKDGDAFTRDTANV
jgi:hypothetical protein